jgi:4-carboxymuconolactone decarboxylase
MPDARTRTVRVLSARIASRTPRAFKVMLGGALHLGVAPVEVEEIVRQAVAHRGIVEVFYFLWPTNDVLTSRGVKLPLEGQSTTTPDARIERGLAPRKAGFGEMTDSVYADSPPDGA